MHGAEVPACGWLHGKKGDDLKEMILYNVAQATGGFVKRAALARISTVTAN
jgi:hypothetical protein